jgi:hypothetical protein
MHNSQKKFEKIIYTHAVYTAIYCIFLLSSKPVLPFAGLCDNALRLIETFLSRLHEEWLRWAGKIECTFLNQYMPL